MSADSDERLVLVDASVFITLARIDAIDPLLNVEGTLVVPTAVEAEITSQPANRALLAAKSNGSVRTVDATDRIADAARYLGKAHQEDDRSEHDTERIGGDLALVALALHRGDVGADTPGTVVVTDDKPLRKTCKALSIPISGSIGVLVRAVERGDLDPETATEKLYAMDEVGARLSATLVRKAERLIDEAGE